jgi:hypothetical protein
LDPFGNRKFLHHSTAPIFIYFAAPFITAATRLINPAFSGTESMASKKILSIGATLASDDLDFAEFSSKRSLLDYDIIVFKPTIDSYLSYAEQFQGKQCLSETSSFQLKESCLHWSREIKQAYENGKTVLIYLTTFREIYVDSGEKSYSGTGRNQKTTRHVTLYNNYNAIPMTVGPVATNGSAMKLASKGAEVLAAYWSEFEKHSRYEVILTNSKAVPCLITRTGEKTVGAMLRSQNHSGTILLLPNIDFDNEKFSEIRKDGAEYWTKEGSQFGARFISSIVALDKALQMSSDVTPEPAWATGAQFSINVETELRHRLTEADQKVQAAQVEKEQILETLATAGRHRALLYEKGKALEAAIIAALHLMGFSAAPFKQSDSEFDVVFASEDGRLIGEAEGKDTKAINVDKLRQLSMNIHEDLQREEVENPAKPVLFGNAFRLLPLSERGDPFTEKCQIAAASASTALVFTPDLFTITQYLIDNSDPAYAADCRAAIFKTTGRVIFPPTPISKDSTMDTEVDNDNTEEVVSIKNDGVN